MKGFLFADLIAKSTKAALTQESAQFVELSVVVAWVDIFTGSV